VSHRDPGALRRTPRRPSPARQAERARQLLDEGVQLDLGGVGPCPVVGQPGLVDVLLQISDPFLVRAPGLVVELRAGGTAHVGATHQLEGVNLTSGRSQ